jgi:hypothetical protein
LPPYTSAYLSQEEDYLLFRDNEKFDKRSTAPPWKKAKNMEFFNCLPYESIAQRIVRLTHAEGEKTAVRVDPPCTHAHGVPTHLNHRYVWQGAQVVFRNRIGFQRSFGYDAGMPHSQTHVTFYISYFSFYH